MLPCTSKGEPTACLFVFRAFGFFFICAQIDDNENIEASYKVICTNEEGSLEIKKVLLCFLRLLVYFAHLAVCLSLCSPFGFFFFFLTIFEEPRNLVFFSFLISCTSAGEAGSSPSCGCGHRTPSARNRFSNHSFFRDPLFVAPSESRTLDSGRAIELSLASPFTVVCLLPYLLLHPS